MAGGAVTDDKGIRFVSQEINLCDTCEFSVPSCEAKRIQFRTSVGNDNVIKCDSYRERKNVKS